MSPFSIFQRYDKNSGNLALFSNAYAVGITTDTSYDPEGFNLTNSSVIFANPFPGIVAASCLYDFNDPAVPRIIRYNTSSSSDSFGISNDTVTSSSESVSSTFSGYYSLTMTSMTSMIILVVSTQTFTLTPISYYSNENMTSNIENSDYSIGQELTLKEL